MSRPKDPLIDLLADELGMDRAQAGKYGLRRLVGILLGRRRGRPKGAAVFKPARPPRPVVDVERMVELAFRRRA
jgi:hypothetical protein